MTTHPHPPRAWLDVPFGEKDEAKTHGARWDPAARRWYDPRPATAALQRWAPRPDVPDLLPGEDRTFGSGLFVDMVPRTCWFTNVRTCVDERDWERLRRMILGRARYRCEACGAAEDRDARRWLEAHERWSYDDSAGTQTLRRLICLCSPCHLATHLGHANVTGRAGEALAHLRQVTGMTEPQLARHIDEAGRLWTTRSARAWRLDLRMLTAAGVTLRQPESPAQRSRTADRTLAAHRAGPASRPPGMSVHPLHLPGWDGLSTWGHDSGGLFYAQLTPNGVSDADGPQVWISAPGQIVRSRAELAAAIVSATGQPAELVDRAMSRGTEPDMAEQRAPGETSRPPDLPRQVDDDLSRAVAGQGVTREATRRRGAEGAGADRSWRLGADGEAIVGTLLARLTEPTLWGRVRGRRPPWHVVHSVPLHDEHGNQRGDIDHVVIGPPGIVTINTKHHQTGKLVLDGDQLTLNGRPTDYVRKARREAVRAEQFVHAALTNARWSAPAPRVRAMIVIVGGRLTIRQWAPKVTVVMTDRLIDTLRSFPENLDHSHVSALYEIARRGSTWRSRSA